MRHRFVLFGNLFILTLFLAGCKASGEPSITVYSSEGPVAVQVEVARTAAERKQGLMGRSNLEDGKGMLFIFDPKDHPSMWMKDMLIPLDLLFIDKDMIVRQLENSVPPCVTPKTEDCPQYSSDEASSFVLELPSGYAKKNGIRSGDRVQLLNISGF